MLSKSEQVQIWYVKYQHEWLPFNSLKAVQTNTKIYPLCKQNEEDTAHFQQCSTNPVTYAHYRDSFKRIWDRYQVDPILQTLLRRALNNESNDTNTLKTLHQFPINDYMDLLKHQEKIGWQQMKYGRWSLHWDRLQCRYSLSQGAKSQGNEPTWQQKP